MIINATVASIHIPQVHYSKLKIFVKSFGGCHTKVIKTLKNKDLKKIIQLVLKEGYRKFK